MKYKNNLALNVGIILLTGGLLISTPFQTPSIFIKNLIEPWMLIIPGVFLLILGANTGSTQILGKIVGVVFGIYNPLTKKWRKSDGTWKTKREMQDKQVQRKLDEGEKE